jgi:hypothetical protein
MPNRVSPETEVAISRDERRQLTRAHLLSAALALMG